MRRESGSRPPAGENEEVFFAVARAAGASRDAVLIQLRAASDKQRLSLEDICKARGTSRARPTGAKKTLQKKNDTELDLETEKQSTSSFVCRVSGFYYNKLLCTLAVVSFAIQEQPLCSAVTRGLFGRERVMQP